MACMVRVAVSRTRCFTVKNYGGSWGDPLDDVRSKRPCITHDDVDCPRQRGRDVT